MLAYSHYGKTIPMTWFWICNSYTKTKFKLENYYFNFSKFHDLVVHNWANVEDGEIKTYKYLDIFVSFKLAFIKRLQFLVSTVHSSVTREEKYIWQKKRQFSFSLHFGLNCSLRFHLFQYNLSWLRELRI